MFNGHDATKLQATQEGEEEPEMNTLLHSLITMQTPQKFTIVVRRKDEDEEDEEDEEDDEEEEEEQYEVNKEESGDKQKLKTDPLESHKKQQKLVINQEGGDARTTPQSTDKEQREMNPEMRHRFEIGSRLIGLFGTRRQLLSIEDCTDNVSYQDEIDRLSAESSPQNTRSTEDKQSAAQTLARYAAEQKANKTLDKKAAEKSLKIIAVKADGSCLMSAINTAHFAANKFYLLTNDEMRMMAATLARNFYLQQTDIQIAIGPSELKTCLAEITIFMEKDNASHSDIILEALATIANCNITVLYEDRDKSYTFSPNTQMLRQLHGANHHSQQPKKTIYIVNRARHTTTGDIAPEHYNAAIQIRNGTDDEGNRIEDEVRRRDEKKRYFEKDNTTPGKRQNMQVTSREKTQMREESSKQVTTKPPRAFLQSLMGELSQKKKEEHSEISAHDDEKKKKPTRARRDEIILPTAQQQPWGSTTPILPKTPQPSGTQRSPVVPPLLTSSQIQKPPPKTEISTTLPTLTQQSRTPQTPLTTKITQQTLAQTQAKLVPRARPSTEQKTAKPTKT
jgi:hypothetical protein